MTWPFSLPDWVPWWVPLVLLVPALLYGLAFLFMPFSVIGVKSRLEAVEVRLDELHAELRYLVLRLPEASHQPDFDDIYPPDPTPQRPAEPQIMRPPIPPASHDLMDRGGYTDRPAPAPHTRPVRRNEPVERPSRTEPRLDRPRL